MKFPYVYDIHISSSNLVFLLQQSYLGEIIHFPKTNDRRRKNGNLLHTNQQFLYLYKFLPYAIKNNRLILGLIAIRENRPYLEEILQARKNLQKEFPKLVFIHCNLLTK